MSEDLRYPIGIFEWTGSITPAQRAEAIAKIAGTPAALRKALEGLTPEQIETPYRPDGWTVRQVVHHLADSHMNCFIRFQLALTEDNPTVKPYDEVAWALRPDYALTPLETSLTVLDALTERWAIVLNAMTEAEWDRTFLHPDNGLTPLRKAVAFYGWHGPHHVAHVTALRARMGW